jgi:hypothetical protein
VELNVYCFSGVGRGGSLGARAPTPNFQMCPYSESKVPFTRWSNLAKCLPLVRARIVSGHLTESGQFFEKCRNFKFSPQVRGECEPAVLGENLLNMTSMFTSVKNVV